jgi:hypothetical protein
MASEGKREVRSGVLGVGMGFALLVALGFWLFRQHAQPRDGVELLAEWFQDAELPFGLEVQEAAELMDGEELVKLARASAPVEEPRKSPTAKSPTDGATIRWEELPQGSPDQPPREVVLAHFPTGGDAGVIARLFGPQESSGIGQVGSQGGKVLVDAGKLPWGEFDVDYVYEREFEAGGTFVDTVRINLTQPGRVLVLRARWSRNETFSKSRTKELLAALRRRESDSAKKD